MKITVFVAVILLIGCRCFGQEKERSKSAFTYSAGIAYNQIRLQRNCYAADEYGVSSSPFNWGVTPYFSVTKNRLSRFYGINFTSCSRRKDYFSELFSVYSEKHINLDKWQEADVVFAVGYRITGERSPISVAPFLGMDLSYLLNYEKTIITDYTTSHYNTDQLEARITNYFFTNFLGLGLLGGIGFFCPIAKHFEIGISYCFKFKLMNNIRSGSNPHSPPSITSPVLYHNANIGVSYRFD